MADDDIPVYRDDHREPMGHIRAADVDARVDARLRALGEFFATGEYVSIDGHISYKLRAFLASRAPREPATGGGGGQQAPAGDPVEGARMYYNGLNMADQIMQCYPGDFDRAQAVIRDAMKREQEQIDRLTAHWYGNAGDSSQRAGDATCEQAAAPAASPTPPRGVPMGGEDVTDGVRAQLRVRELEAERDAARECANQLGEEAARADVTDKALAWDTMDKASIRAERAGFAEGVEAAAKVCDRYADTMNVSSRANTVCGLPSQAVECKMVAAHDLAADIRALAPSPAPDALPGLLPPAILRFANELAPPLAALIDAYSVNLDTVKLRPLQQFMHDNKIGILRVLEHVARLPASPP